MSKSLIESKQAVQTDFSASFVTRAFDLICATFGLMFLAPVFLMIGLIVKVSSDGHIFYIAKRVGLGGRIFNLYKFRTMYSNAAQQGPGITVSNDPRITPVGRFLRRTKLDELPQLINVLRGDMSIVGPRPEDPRYVALYTPEQRQILNARPGLTSPASRHHREEEQLLKGDQPLKLYCEQIMPRKLAADLAYLRRRTFWTDIALILETITAVFNGGAFLNTLLTLRNRHFFAIDISFLLITPLVALIFRLDGLAWWPQYSRALLFYTIISLFVKVPIFYNARLYDRYWRYAGVNDLTRVIIGVGLATVVIFILFFTMHPLLEPYNLAMFRAVPLIDGLLTGLAVGGLRFGSRALYHWHRQHTLIMGGRRVLVVGAGEAGNMVVRELRANPQLNMEPIVFADDDPTKIGRQIQGLPVGGSSKDIPSLIGRHQIQRIIVAIPSAPLGRQRELMAKCKQTGLPTSNLPGVYQLLAGHKTVSRLPEININQLLKRKPIVTDHTEVRTKLNGAKVLVTGAGGSIGSELSLQLARFQPKSLILLGHGENSIFEIDLNLKLSFPDLTTHPVIIDVRDQHGVDSVVEKFAPDILFHAAAHKHVPFMQASIVEAVINNVVGTYNVLKAAEKHNVERFVLISTDKAVKPTSIMGATKRMAELLVRTFAYRSEQAFMSVRFGNVLGSRGSVVPVFQQQIASGGPVTVTHPDMRRYFMTIPEAVQLVLQASILGQGGEIFVLDMGRPVKILDLATELINLSGLELGRDIEIVFNGIRPGEKLSEELFLDHEIYHRTRQEKIFVANQPNSSELKEVERTILELIRMVKQKRVQMTTEQMRNLVLKACNEIDQTAPSLPDDSIQSSIRPNVSASTNQPSSPNLSSLGA